MKKGNKLLRFRIYDGDREYTDYAVIDKHQRLLFTDKQIISKFFYDNKVDEDHMLSDGRGVSIESEISITDADAKKLESLHIAFLHDFELEEVA